MDHDVHYLVVKKKEEKALVYMEYDPLQGFDITPKSGKSFEDCIHVNKMILIQPTLIEKLVHKKVERHFQRLLTIVTMLLNADDDTGTGLFECLSEIEKFRQEIKNKYRDYMSKEELHFMAKKLTILKEEVEQKRMAMEQRLINEHQKTGKSR